MYSIIMGVISIAYINHWDLRELLFDIIRSNFPNESIIKVNPEENPTILICSVFGDINMVKNTKARYKIFYTGENPNRYSPYNDDKLLCRTFDLIIGFNKTDLSNKRINFPLWLYMWSRDKKVYNYDKKNNILSYIEGRNRENLKNKKGKFATFVSSHDCTVRRKIGNEMERYGKVFYPGKFRKNTKEISNRIDRWTDKINYISDSIYNICPENSKGEGYFTEKIFHAFEAGTIPIYWAIDYPEPRVINRKRLLLVDLDNIGKIGDVIVNKERYLEGPLFIKGADEYVNELYTTLIKELGKIIDDIRENCNIKE
tara:strand:+ start:618 stop:1559 length:942 start_codon:yes stop_codon:yes gene_type:complete